MKSPTSPPNQDLAKRNQTYLLKLTINFFQSDVQNHSEPYLKFSGIFLQDYFYSVTVGTTHEKLLSYEYEDKQKTGRPKF